MPMISSCFSFLYPRFFLGFPTVFPWFFPCFQHQFMLFLCWFYDKFSLDNPMFFPCSYISKTLHYPLFFLSCITGKTNVGDGSVIINSSNNLLIPSLKQRIQRKKTWVFARRGRRFSRDLVAVFGIKNWDLCKKVGKYFHPLCLISEQNLVSLLVLLTLGIGGNLRSSLFEANRFQRKSQGWEND